MALGRDRFAQGIVIRLFRAWSAQTEAGAPAMARLQQIVAPLGLPDESAIACASLFELIESHLGRRLERECCCSPRYSRDERALLGVIELAPSLGSLAGSATGSRAVPHGLPGAIVWACVAIRRAFGMSEGGSEAGHAAAPDGQCPFAAGPAVREVAHGA
ncbi:hypothetical protein [Pelagerythrobacter sp.]|uniref:hypothetical protein n=1 Tax=Pelagerythrobacter sp. TaxID=2800702 RepID=UPI0035B2142C